MTLPSDVNEGINQALGVDGVPHDRKALLPVATAEKNAGEQDSLTQSQDAAYRDTNQVPASQVRSAENLGSRSECDYQALNTGDGVGSVPAELAEIGKPMDDLSAADSSASAAYQVFDEEFGRTYRGRIHSGMLFEDLENAVIQAERKAAKPELAEVGQ